MEETIEQKTYAKLIGLLNDLNANKPNDRSENDRRYAIVITDLEKLIAYYKAYILK